MKFRSANTPPSAEQACSHRLLIVALLACLATLTIATFYPSGKPADETMALSFGATYAWIGTQALVLTIPGLLLGVIVGAVMPRLGTVLGSALILAVPLVVLCDAMTFSWVAERFLSNTMGKISTTLLPGLMLHITSAMIMEATLTIAVVCFLIAVFWRGSGYAARWWKSQEQSVRPSTAGAVFLSIAAILSVPAVWNLDRTLSEMAIASTRHPFCAFHLVGFRGVGVHSPEGRVEAIARLRGLQAVSAVQERDRRQISLRVDQEALQQSIGERPTSKVIVVVIECLRPEIIDPEVMPNLHAFAEKSIFCRRNFSSGNATCYGMFGLVTGLDAVWFRRPVGEKPIFNRLLHEAGFDIGFYGGQTDWRNFGMSGFISPDHFDDFQTELPDLPHSDIRTVQRAIQFLDQADSGTIGGESDSSSARASVAYMFGTHSRYSDPEDKVFEPAAKENLSIARSPEQKQLFYNAYKNSARTMDRLIKPLLRDDCAVIIVGDHGEPILDDGTACHGTRLSRYQNMTPAVIYYPGVTPRKIDHPTYHADALPTLLSIVNIPLTDWEVFDGVDLTKATDDQLAHRYFLSRNYMDSTSLLVGPWTFQPDQPFGYRVVFNIHDWQNSYLNPIDDLGFEWAATTDDQGKQRFAKWVTDHFGADSADESQSQQELFERFLGSSDKETRMSALRIAGDVPDPNDHLYDLISESTRDNDPEIREYARDLVIRINRSGNPKSNDP